MVEMLLGDLAELGELDDPGIRKEDVDRLGVLHDPGVKSVKVSRISDDTLDGSRFVPQRLECRIQPGFISTSNKYASPLVDELPGRGQTHAADCLGDDGDLPFQSLHFGSSLQPDCHVRWLRERPARTIRPTDLGRLLEGKEMLLPTVA
jgi:hypothetical protein